MKKLKIFLSGGGDEKQSVKLDNLFHSHLEKDKPLLYIPHAADPGKFKSYYSWISNVFKNLEIKLVKNLSKIKLEQLKFKFSGVYIGGGNTYKLKEILVETRFWNVLRSYALAGKPVYGGSAGAILLGKYISTCDEKKTEAKVKNYKGLNLINDFSITCHFNKSLNLVNHKNIQKIIALPEETGLFFNGNSFKVIGAKQAYFINVNNYKPGDEKT